MASVARSPCSSGTFRSCMTHGRLQAATYARTPLVLVVAVTMMAEAVFSLPAPVQQIDARNVRVALCNATQRWTSRVRRNLFGCAPRLPGLAPGVSGCLQPGLRKRRGVTIVEARTEQRPKNLVAASRDRGGRTLRLSLKCTCGMTHSVATAPSGIGYPLWSTGNGSPLFLLHGFTGSHETWRDLRRSALGRSPCHDIWIFTGHGESGGGSPVRGWTFATVIYDLAWIIKSQLGGTAEILGYSMGGRLAWHSRLNHPCSRTPPDS